MGSKFSSTNLNKMTPDMANEHVCKLQYELNYNYQVQSAKLAYLKSDYFEYSRECLHKPQLLMVFRKNREQCAKLEIDMMNNIGYLLTRIEITPKIEKTINDTINNV